MRSLYSNLSLPANISLYAKRPSLIGRSVQCTCGFNSSRCTTKAAMFCSPYLPLTNVYTSLAHCSISDFLSTWELSELFSKSTVWLPKASSCIRSLEPPKMIFTTVRNFGSSNPSLGSLIPRLRNISAFWYVYVKYLFCLCHTLFPIVSDNPPCPSLLLAWTPLPVTSVSRGIRLPIPFVPWQTGKPGYLIKPAGRPAY